MCSPKHTALVSVQHLRDHHKSGNPRLVAGSPRARSCAARASVARDTHTDASTHASGVHARNPRLLRRPRLEQAHTTGPRLVLAAKAATRARARCSSRGRSSRCTTAARRPGSSEDPRWSRRLAPRIAVGVMHRHGDARQVEVAKNGVRRQQLSDQKQDQKQQQEQEQQAQELIPRQTYLLPARGRRHTAETAAQTDQHSYPIH